MSDQPVRPISETLKQYGRSIAGGLLFAVAAIYTMEIWWQGYTTPPHVVLTTFVGALVVLAAYAHYAGMRDEKTIVSDVMEALESLALGFLITALLLKLIGQLPSEISWFEAISRIVMVGVNASIGVAVGSTQLGKDPDEQKDGESGEKSEGQEKGSIGHEVVLSFLGAILISSSVAPTEEILMIGVQAKAWEALVISILSFGIALGVVSYTNFKGSSSDGSVFAGGPFGDACVTYAVGLLASAALLWTAGRFGETGFSASLTMVVYLGLPGALGASAGRMLL